MSAAADPAGDAPDPFPRKHPLEHRWSLWFEQKQSTGLRSVHTFDNVEDFWW